MDFQLFQCAACVVLIWKLQMTFPFNTFLHETNTFNYHLDWYSISNIVASCNKDVSLHLKHFFLPVIIHSISAIWSCRNQASFNNTKTHFALAIKNIYVAIYLTGTLPKAHTNNSMDDFRLLRFQN